MCKQIDYGGNMEIVKDIKREIFKAYDIRGKYPEQIDKNIAYTIGKSYGTMLLNKNKNTCIVGYDNRHSSMELSLALVLGILSTGVDVISLGLVTTPMALYAKEVLKIPSYIMVTASHNPKDDNGFKFSFDESGNVKGSAISDFYDFTVNGKFSEGVGRFSKYDITKDYLNLYKNDIKLGNRKLKVVLDLANGTTSVIARKIFELFDLDLTIINEESDSDFPNHHPDPCVSENQKQLSDKVLELGADIGIGFDGDGDRLGVVDENGNYIPTDKYMIMIIRDIINKVDKKEFLYDVKCSKSLSDEIEKLGAKGICYRTGNSYTKAKVKDDNLPFGGELSGHVYFNDKWPCFDSGLYAGLRLLEILSHTNKNVSELLEGINEYYSTPELKFASPDDKKFAVVEKIKKYAIEKGYEIIDIDGVRVNFSDGWALVRASNTGPNLTARFEAKIEDRLEKIKKEFTDLIEEYNK